MSKEIKRTAKLFREIAQLGVPVYPLVAGPRAPKGWPDRMIAWSGSLWLIEMKDETTRLRADQIVVMDWLRKHVDGRVLVARFIGENELRVDTGSKVWTCPAKGRAFLQELKRYEEELRVDRLAGSGDAAGDE